MDEYISREEVLKKFLERGSGYINELTMRDIINEISAADVQPVRHGRWEYIRNVKLSGTIKLCECNICHNKVLGGLSYCGNCGARMDGDKE